MLKYQHPDPHKPQHMPYLWDKPQYRQTTLYAKPADNSPKLDANGIKHTQRFMGKLLYYSRAIDNTMLMEINAISEAQTNGTTASRSGQVTVNYANHDIISLIGNSVLC